MTANRGILARRIALLRGLQGWDQATLAARAAVPPDYIRAIEDGEAVPLDALEGLCEALGVPILDLIEPTPLGMIRTLLDGARAKS